ncbi:MAG: hypothetical protein U0892_15225 [Pirellulales bacterium]
MQSNACMTSYQAYGQADWLRGNESMYAFDESQNGRTITWLHQGNNVAVFVQDQSSLLAYRLDDNRVMEVVRFVVADKIPIVAGVIKVEGLELMFF